MTKDLRPYLFDFVPDPEAVKDAGLYADGLPAAPMQAVHSFVMCFSSFYNDYAAPGLPEGLSEAVGVLAYAASGLYALLEREGHEEGEDLALTRLKDWKTLAHARLWAVRKLAGPAAGFADEERESLALAVRLPHLLPMWSADMTRAGRAREAATFAAWYTVAHLLEAAPMLEDGEAEDLTAALLAAFTPGAAPWRGHAGPPMLTLSLSPEDLPFPGSDLARGEVPGLTDFLPTVQHVEVLEAGRIRLEIEGGEGYEVSREDCIYTPTATGAALLACWPGTPDTAVLKLTPYFAGQVAQLLAFDETPSAATDPRLN